MKLEILKQKLMQKYGETISIIDETFTRYDEPAVFLDKDYGEWKTKPIYVINGRLSRKRAVIERSQFKKIAKPGTSIADLCPDILSTWNDTADPFTVNKYSEFQYNFKCLQGHPDYLASPCSKFMGKGCPECGKIKSAVSRSKAKPGKSIAELFPFVLDMWADPKDPREMSAFSHKKVLLKCLVDKDHPVFETIVASISKMKKCPYCAGQKVCLKNSLGYRSPHLIDEWDYEKNKISPFEITNGSGKKFNWICHKNSNHKWETAPALRTREAIATGCPSCQSTYSNLEKFIENKLNIKKYNKRIRPGAQPDFKLTDTLYLNVDGLYYHSDKFKEKSYHFSLRENFEAHNERILQFYEDEVYEKWPIVESIINNARGTIGVKIMARKCQPRTLTALEMASFFEQNHLMGNHKASRGIGLFFEGRLVSAISYRIEKQKEYLEISRFCSILGMVVIGGFQKLLALAEDVARFCDLQKMVSFCDLRYATGSSYEKAGFFKASKPSLGWCWVDNKKRHNRLLCKAGNGKTEKENAAQKKWLKIYDAGQAKYVKEIL